LQRFVEIVATLC